MARPPKTYWLRGALIHYVRERPSEDADGECDPPGPRREIRIDPNLPVDRTLEVLIHEGLHACLWDLGHEAVEETAESLAALVLGEITASKRYEN